MNQLISNLINYSQELVILFLTIQWRPVFGKALDCGSVEKVSQIEKGFMNSY